MRFNALPADKFSFDHVYLALDSDEITLMVGDPDAEFALASVTKPIAAWSILIAADQGKLSLDDDAGPDGSTFRHLLSHSSGLPPSKGKPIAEPGRRRIYSDYGFEVLGDAVAERVGMPIQEWVTSTVFEPLEMDTATLDGAIAYSARATADSLAKFVVELMNPTLIPAELAKEAVTPQFAELAGILPGYGRQDQNLWGLGFSIRGEKNPHWLGSDFSPTTFGHFGQSGSFIWVDPEVQKAGLFLGEKPFSEEHIEIWPDLTSQMRAI